MRTCCTHLYKNCPYKGPIPADYCRNTLTVNPPYPLFAALSYNCGEVGVNKCAYHVVSLIIKGDTSCNECTFLDDCKLGQTIFLTLKREGVIEDGKEVEQEGCKGSRERQEESEA